VAEVVLIELDDDQLDRYRTTPSCPIRSVDDEQHRCVSSREQSRPVRADVTLILLAERILKVGEQMAKHNKKLKRKRGTRPKPSKYSRNAKSKAKKTRKGGVRRRMDVPAFLEWRDKRVHELTVVAVSAGWSLDREYDSLQGSRYLWFRRGPALVKLRLSDHGIDYLRAPSDAKRPTASWSISIEWRGLWEERLQKAVERLRAAA